MNQTNLLSLRNPYVRRNHASTAEKHPLFQRLVLFAATVLSLAGIAIQTEAQTNLIMKPFQARVEIQPGFVGTVLLTNNNLRVPTNGATGVDGTGTNWIIANVTASISGAPSGVTATLVNSDFATPVGSIPINMNTNNASKSTNLVVKLDFDGTQVSGVTSLIMTASGGGLPDDSFVMPLEVAKIWNGSAMASVNGSGNWSDASKWLGGVPSTNDSVVFTDLGTQTNALLVSATSTNVLTNSVVDVTTVISSLRFCQTNSTGTPLTNNHNLSINPGVTLAVVGNEGFKLLRDYTFWTPKMNVTFVGTNGSFVQTNEHSNFALLTDGANAANTFETLDMSRLGNIQLDVNQVNIGNIFGYPNYLCFASNSYTSGSTLGGSRPQKIQPAWNMAMTNSVKAVFVDPFNYNNSFSRDYAMVIGRNDLTGGSSGNDQIVSMGLTNAFFMDGICVGGFGSLGAVLNFLNTNSTAVFRNTNGGRMSIFTCGDGAGTVSLNASAGVNTKCGNSGFGVDFTKGKVDILVDRFFMSMDRGLTTGGGGQVQSSLGLVNGTIDANSAFIGYQASGNQTNLNNCVGTLTVSNIGVFKVHGTLALGYTASSAGDPSSPQTSFGKINIGPGGTVLASNITVGGITKTTAGNNIALTGGASLVVSNGIGDATPGGALGLLSFGGNSTMTLFIDGSKPAVPLVYVTNLTATSTGNKLIIGGVTNLTFPADVVLIDGVSATVISAGSFDAGVSMPPGSGLTGTLSLSSSNTINIHIINRAPNHLVWRGASPTANWDYTTKNWLDQVTLLMTNFDNPDIVAFDDTPGFATNINIAGGTTALTPTVVNMTNNNLYYTFLDGGNQVLGGPALNKFGTGTVEIDGNTTFTVQLNQGGLAGGVFPGSVGGVNIASGAIMNYSGNVGGSLICAGIATSSGSISGTLTVSPGGIVTNSGTVSNPFGVQTNGLLYNSGTGSLNNIGTGSSGSPQVASGGILINNGIINGDVLFVSGSIEDLATGGMTLTSLSLGTGGLFIPGGDSIGTTVIHSDGVGSFPGAALLAQGSTTVFKVDVSDLTNTVLSPAHLSFGASASAQTQNGCTLVMSNISLTPFSAGQVFQLLVDSDSSAIPMANTGSSTNTYPVIVPTTPGPGLVWDLRHLWYVNGAGQNGFIGVVAANSGPTFVNGLSVDPSGSNIVGQLSWDPTNQGFALETLVVPPTVALAPNTNFAWTRIAGSQTNTTVAITNVIGTNDVFYRLSFP